MTLIFDSAQKKQLGAVEFTTVRRKSSVPEGSQAPSPAVAGAVTQPLHTAQ